MASAGDRLQIVIGAKDELTGQLRETRKEMTRLVRAANDMQRRMENGEQGLQDEYEQTRRELQRLGGEYGDLQNKQAAVNREMRQLTSNGRRAQQSTKSFSSGMGKMLGVLGGAATAIAGAAVAFRFLGDSINEARGANKALAQTAAVLRSMGRTDAPEKIEKMLDQLSLASGIDDDNLREMTNVLLTFGNLQGKTFEQANQMALDLSVAFGKDLQSSAVMVGKALNDPIKGLTALSRIGVQFTAEQQEQIKAMMEVNDIAGAQKIIMGELERQVGGSAAAQADAVDKTMVAWGNFKEAIGDAIIDAGGRLAGLGDIDPAKGLRKAKKWLELNGPQVQEALLGIAAATLRVGEWSLLAAAWTTRAYGVALNVLGGMVKVMGFLIPGLGGVGDAMMASGVDAQNAANGLFETADGARELTDKAFAARDRVNELNTALEKVKNKKIRVELYSTMSDVQDAVQQAMQYALDFENRFAGGPVTSGGTYMVGELGPELFVPTYGTPQMVGQGGPEIRDFHASGTIIPADMVGSYMAAQTASLAAVSAAPAPAAGVQIGELHVHDKFDARREFDALLAKQRRIAAERS
jgi:hypothetical protein